MHGNPVTKRERHCATERWGSFKTGHKVSQSSEVERVKQFSCYATSLDDEHGQRGT